MTKCEKLLNFEGHQRGRTFCCKDTVSESSEVPELPRPPSTGRDFVLVWTRFGPPEATFFFFFVLIYSQTKGWIWHICLVYLAWFGIALLVNLGCLAHGFSFSAVSEFLSPYQKDPKGLFKDLLFFLQQIQGVSALSGAADGVAPHDWVFQDGLVQAWETSIKHRLPRAVVL